MSNGTIGTDRQPLAGSEPASFESHLFQSSLLDERRTVDILAIEFAFIVITQKVAIPLGGADNQIPVALLAHYAMLAWLVSVGRAQIDIVRLILLCMFSGAAILTQVGNIVGSFSVPSLGLMLITSSVLIVVVPLHRCSYVRFLEHFAMLSAGASALVLMDWLTQVVGLGMPSLESLIPSGFSYSEYVYIQPLQWDSPWLKPNGLFFLEASHVSQFAAMGLVVELAFFKRRTLIALNAAALVLTFGGTGLVIVGLSIPFLLSKVRPHTLITVAATALCVLIIADSIGLLGAFTNRTAEFSRTNSSAYNRFIMPAERFVEFLQDDRGRLLVGTGAGTMPKAVNNLAQHTIGLAWPPYVKVAVEYGLIAFLCWLSFIVVAMFGGAAPFIAGWIAFVQYQFLNGSLNVPIHTIYCWLLCAGYHMVDGHSGDASPVFRQRLRRLPAGQNAGLS